MIMAQML